MTRPTRFLIVRVGAMGDVLHGLPAVAALRAAMPEAHIGWAVEPRWQALLGTPTVDHVHLVPTRDWKARPFSARTAQQILALRRELHVARYDVCIDLQGSIRSAAIARFSGASRIIGPDAPRERHARLLYTERVPLKSRHVISQACELVGRAAGLRLAPAPVAFPVDPASTLWARQFPPGFVLLAPTAGWGAKEWGAESYRQLALRLAQTDRPILVNGLPGDLTAANVGHETKALCISGSLPQLIALTRRAALVIGGDTGPVHLAAALGIPTLALFGPTDPARNGPDFPGARTRVLRHPASTLSHKRTSRTEAGLAQVSVDEVYLAALALLERADQGAE